MLKVSIHILHLPDIATYALIASSVSASPVIPSLSHTGISPITQLYHSTRQEHSTSQTGFHPFIGARLNLPSTSIANQARLASASNTIPRQVSLPIRGRRRNRVHQAPTLSRTVPKVSIEDCKVDDLDTLVPSVRIVARVLPPLVNFIFHLYKISITDN
jgi:hypothetical protein